MQTRIIQTSVFRDDWFLSLKAINRFLFIYFLVNEHVSILWLYQCPDALILFETGVTPQELSDAKSKFEEDGKIAFYKGWIYLLNAYRYENYKGESNETAKAKFLEKIGNEVLDWYNNKKDRGVGRGVLTPSRIQNTETHSINIDREKKSFFENSSKLIVEEKKEIVATSVIPDLTWDIHALIDYEQNFDPQKHPASQGFTPLPVIIKWWIAKELKTSQSAVNDFHDELLVRYKAGALSNWEKQQPSLFTLLVNKISFSIKEEKLPTYPDDNKRALGFDKLKPPSYLIREFKQAEKIFKENPAMGEPRPLPKNLWQ